MPDTVAAGIVLVLYAAMWFWVGRDFGKSAEHKKLIKGGVREVSEGDWSLLEDAAKAAGMPMNEWVLRQAVAEARRRQG